MFDIKVGDMAKSLCGHDKNSYYLILEVKDGYVYLCDGYKRKIDNPKRKKIKHIQVINIEDKSDSILKTNESIKLFLKTHGGNNV